jgi:hypothetical protein
MPTIEVWVVLGEDDSYEVATDEDTALERLKDGSDDDLAGTLCRVVKLNVTMGDQGPPANVDKTDKAVDLVVPDDAGRTVTLPAE